MMVTLPTRRRARPGLVPAGTALLAAWLLLPAAALAQSPSCELLKQSLAARIPPAISGYAMDDVPARTPVPAGGKVIGTCEGGARKVVYRRFGGPPLGDGSGPAAATAPPASATMTAPPVREPAAARPRAPAASAPGPTPVTAARQPSTPAVVPSAPARSQQGTDGNREKALAPLPVPTPVLTPAPMPMTLAVHTGASAVPSLPDVAVRAAAEPAPASPAAPALPDSASDDTPGFFARHGQWLWLLLAVPLIAWLWAWVSHRMAYDSAGLPRGPRLRL